MASAALLETFAENRPSLGGIFNPTFLSKFKANGAGIVSVICDDRCERDSLEFQIQRQGWQAEAFGSARDFLDRPRALVASCLILAFSCVDRNGVLLQKQIANERPDLPIIVISSSGDVPTTVESMKAGALDFLVKPLSHDVLVAAIRQGLERSSVALRRELEIAELRKCYASLSRRERQVMSLVVSGLLNKQVGGELGISEITVKAHRGQVMLKMKADSLAQLVIMAARLRPSRFTNPSSLLQEPVHSEVVS